MARPIKCRKVCHYPNTLNFVPKDNDCVDNVITLTVDEYETIRLIDKEGVSQEECSKLTRPQKVRPKNLTFRRSVFL